MRFVNIKKTDGRIEKFDAEKIRTGLIHAFEDAEYTDYTEHLTAVFNGVIGQLEQFPGVFRPTTSQLCSIIEDTLVYLNHTRVAKAWILFRDKKKRIHESKKAFISAVDTMSGYLSQNDWRVHENSNVNYSIGGAILHSAGAITANYWLNEIYPKNIGDAHKNGDLHLHDLSMLTSYCNGNSLLTLIKEGLGGVSKQTSSKPPKYMRTLMDQMINHLGIMQNEFAGAQAYGHFDTFIAPFIKNENLPYKEVKQNIQHFIFGINVPSRWGNQAPFTNITLDWVVPRMFMKDKAWVDGKQCDFTYEDCQYEMDMVNKAFLEVMEEGDATGRGFPYPIPTYNVTKDFDWNNPNCELLFKMTGKYGTPYFSNFINSDMDPEDSFSMCCRLRLDLSELKRRGGGLFGAEDGTGSVGVVTINLPRIAYRASKHEDKQEFFFKELEKLMSIAKESLEIKRKVIESFLKTGLYPYTQRYVGNFNNHFSTIGIVGGNEACLNLLGVNIVDPAGQEFCLSTLNFMRDKMVKYQEETGNLYNLEATPAEGTSYRLAKKDSETFDNIITAGTKDSPYYTNSTQLPVNYTADIFEALDIQDKFQCLYTGGTVVHAFLGESIKDWRATRSLIKKILNNYHLPYLSISPTYSICQHHGYLSGEKLVCPKCLERIKYLENKLGELNKGE